MIFITGILLILFISGIIEKQRHQHRLHSIPVRIHINGTRGKSLLTRMVTDLFYNAGWSVAAKVTGEQPTVFNNQQGWKPWKRHAPARIQEQSKFIRYAHQHNAKAVVIENMALAPENQYISESQMVKASLCIITNTREDHQEIMGNTVKDVYHTLRFSFPPKNPVLIPESEYNSDLMPGKTSSPVNRGDSGKCQYNITIARENTADTSIAPVFRSHIALLKKVKDIYKLPDNAYDNTLDRWRSSLRLDHLIIPLTKHSTTPHLINLFSCNDVTSTAEIVRHLETKGAIQPPYDIILTCRIDRPLRSLAFLHRIISDFSVHRLVITGAYPLVPVNRLLKLHKDKLPEIMKFWEIHPGKIFNKLQPGSFSILGLGNYINTGEKVITYLTKESNGH